MSDRYDRMCAAAPSGFEIAQTGELADGKIKGRYAFVAQRSKNCFIVNIKGFSPVRCCDADSASALFEMVVKL